jgi:hypothetical protein
LACPPQLGKSKLLSASVSESASRSVSVSTGSQPESRGLSANHDFDADTDCDPDSDPDSEDSLRRAAKFRIIHGSPERQSLQYRTALGPGISPIRMPFATAGTAGPSFTRACPCASLSQGSRGRV